MHLFLNNIISFLFNPNDVCNQGYNGQKVSRGPGNDSTPNRQLIITWARDDPVDSRIFA